MLVGAGNLATSLGVAMKKMGITPAGVWSRTYTSANALAERLGCIGSDNLSQFPTPEIVIISVADNALYDVACNVARLYPQALILHTAGSVPMDILRDAGCSRYGVFYPMQTFSKARIVDFSTFYTFIEGCDKTAEEDIRKFAESFGGKVCAASSEQRRYLHVAAVFACNFSNALYAMSANLLDEHGLPFDAMLPLIDETAAKVHKLPPRNAQTGPAQRGDTVVMEQHRKLLNDDLLHIYNILSEYIQNNRQL